MPRRSSCRCWPPYVLRPTADDVFIGSPPLAFTFGLGGLLLFPMAAGASTVLLEKATPPHLLDESTLWQAYAQLDKSRVKGASGKRILTDLVSLVRFAIHQDNELIPFPERVNANFRGKWVNAENIGKTEAEIIAMWNTAHPGDLIPTT